MNDIRTRKRPPHNYATHPAHLTNAPIASRLIAWHTSKNCAAYVHLALNGKVVEVLAIDGKHYAVSLATQVVVHLCGLETEAKYKAAVEQIARDYKEMV